MKDQKERERLFPAKTEGKKPIAKKKERIYLFPLPQLIIASIMTFGVGYLIHEHAVAEREREREEEEEKFQAYLEKVHGAPLDPQQKKDQ
jgi:hypothetical protein